jgi:hypothetical protein
VDSSADSGLSVWYLDHGTAPFSHADWVDYVKPKSRGGKDTLENLVCASSFYNCKKLNNGSDCQYLFSEGAPTEIFYFIGQTLLRERPWRPSSTLLRCPLLPTRITRISSCWLR